MRIALLIVSLSSMAVYPTLARGEPAGPTLDAAARIEYGWLTGDATLIRAARESLAGRSSDPWATYLRAYASYRMAELAIGAGVAARSELETCEREAGQASARAEVAAEAELMIAACAALAAGAEPRLCRTADRTPSSTGRVRGAGGRTARRPIG